MRIEILCTDGSPLGVTLKDLWGEGSRGIGTGGAEYALLTLCEGWHNAGHEVILYNNPSSNGSPFEQRSTSNFDPNTNRDVLITFRTPNPKSIIAKGLKVWFSCDQYTSADFKPFAPHMNKIVVISPFHAQYFRDTYQINDTISIDLPVRLNDLKGDYSKIKNRCIFTSIPDRGLSDLFDCWTNTILPRVPDASLVITSDYRLWGATQLNEGHILKWMFTPQVKFMGAIPRRQLIEEQLKAEFLVYPSVYDELFCVSVAEAQACSVYTITTDTGALPTTNMGKVVPRSSINFKATFSDAVTNAMNDPEIGSKALELKRKAWQRFSLENILKQWDEKVFK